MEEMIEWFFDSLLDTAREDFSDVIFKFVFG